MPTAFISNLLHGGVYGPSTFGYPSYWDVTLTGNPYYGSAPNNTYDAWCINPTRFLSVGNTGTINLYSAYSAASGYTAIDASIPTSVFSGSANPVAAVNSLDNVNWLLNQHLTNGPQFSVSEVQIAIWRLFGYGNEGTQYLNASDWQEADVQNLVTAAGAHDGFVPGADDVLAVIGDPTFLRDSANAQPIIIETKFAKLGDFVWHDLNANGIQDASEPGISGASVRLTGTDAFGATVNLTTTTDANGLYLFTRLVPGTYSVTFVTPSGFDSVSPPLQGSDIAKDSNGLVASNIVLTSGADNRTIDSGFYKTTSLGDFVWLDKDADGVQDSGEAGINGVTVRLINAATNAVLATTTTGAGTDDPDTLVNEAAAGYYAFTGLTPGLGYKVQFVNPDAYDASTNPDGYVFSPRQAAGGTAATNSDGPLSDVVTLSSGDFNRTIDAGLYRNGSIHVFGFLDTDGDGVLDITEGAFPNDPGKSIQLINSAGTVIATKVTSNGIADFEGLAPGTYTVTENPIPGGYRLTTPATVTVTISSGEEHAWRQGGAGLPSGDARTEIVQTNLVFGNTPAQPRIDIEKYTNGDDADLPTGPLITVGKIATFTYEVKNPGTEPLKNIVVVDDNGTPGIPFDDFNPTAVLGGLKQTIAGLGTIIFPGIAGSQSNGLGFDLNFSGGFTFDENDIKSVAWTLNGAYQITSLNLVLQHDTNQFGVDFPSSRVDLTLNQAGIGLVQGNGGDVSFSLDANGNPVGVGGAFLIGPTAATPAGAGVNIGDANSDSRLDIGETWLYQASRTVTAGQYTNNSVSTGAGVFSGTPVQDDDPSNHFGVIPASLGNFVWQDKNANGLQDSGEQGIDRVVVRLFKDTNSDGTPETLVVSQLTGDDPSTPGIEHGFYKFAALTPGVAYQVEFVNPDTVGPDAWTFTLPNVGVNDALDSDAIPATGRSQIVTLAPGQYNDTVDAGLYRNGSIHVFGFLDTDGDGVLDITEGAFPNNPGKTIQLLNAAGTVIETKVTNNGIADFEGLAPGTYTVKENPIPGGYLLTTPSTVTVTIGSGEEYAYKATAANLPSGDGRVEIVDTRLVFGNAPLASLGNYVWEDLNANGIQDDGPLAGVPNVSVTLTGGGADGVINGVGDTTATKFTDASGFYLFGNLNSGEQYQVSFTRPNGFVSFTRPDAGLPGTDATDSDVTNPTSLTGITPIVTLTPGQFNDTIDAGLLKPAAVGDFVWRDLNGNGVQNAGEPGVPNVTVTLTGTDALGAPVTRTTTTDGNGGYLFNGSTLLPGTYKVTFTNLPPGVAFTAPDQGGDTTDSDANTTTGMTPTVTVGSGGSNLTLDAGLVGTGIDIIKFVNGDDANAATGPVLVVGSTASFTYQVRNTGNVPLASVTVSDDSGTPAVPGDDFSPSYSGGDDGDNLLEVGETWLYTATRTVVAGQYTNIATTTGTPVYPPGTTGVPPNTPVVGLTPPTDHDPANYFGQQRDYGDLPSSLYSSVLGAYHVFANQNLRMGSAFTDAEPAAQPNAAATGDDLAGATPDDETGVTLPASIIAGQAASFIVNALNNTATAATIYGFIDWNHDGDFLDANETASTTLAAGFFGNATLTFSVPAGANTTDDLGARFRISTDAGLTATTNASNGEVEDYLVRVGPQRASLGNYVWEDLNANGIQDGNEPGVGLVTVTLTGGGANGVIGTGGDDSTVTTTTDGSGFYFFGNLNSGEQYQVSFTRPSGFISFTKPDAIPPGTDATDSDVTNPTSLTGFAPIVTLAPGQYNDTIDAGLLKPAAVGDFVWRDLNGNGVQNAGEPGVPNVTVTLTGTDALGGAVLRTTTTDGNGGYLFNGNTLLPGTYKVTFTNLPPGVAFTAPDQGGNDTTDSDANTTTGMTPTVTVGSGGSNLTLDAGLVGTGIDIIKFVNGDDANAATGPVLVVGSTASFTYQVRNTGNVPLASVTVSDDSGTPAVPGDDFSPSYSGGDDGDNLLEVGETWLYTATRTVVAGQYTNIATTTGTPVYPPGTTGVPPNTPVVGLTPPTDHDPANYFGQQRDYGDLPSSLYSSVLGAYHVFANQNLRMGSAIDPEVAAQPNATATGDDLVGIDDEDGVTIPASIFAGQSATFNVAATNTSGAAATLYGFVDWNRDGDFLDANESVTAGVANGFSGSTALSFNVPADAVLGQDLGARFRISNDAGLNAANNATTGEVEDYLVRVSPPLNPGIEILKDVVGQTTVAPNTPVTFTYSVKNTGGVALSNIVVMDDNATPAYAADDFNPTPVLGANGKNIGDLNGDSKLDLTEVWKYSATVIPPVSMTVTVATGATPIDSGKLIYSTLSNGDVRVTYLQSDNFNDNTYGTGSDAGWTSQGKTHKFGDLVGSDKAGFLIKYSDGTTLAQFYQDYVTQGGTNTEGYTAFSGYQSLGFAGGDGSWVAGTTTAKTWFTDFDSTLETDLNQAGTANNGVAYSAMFTNSPVNDAKWDVVNGYSFTISAAAFTGGKTFGGVMIFDQHNSPAKVGGSNTYIPDIVGGGSVNTAVVTGVGNGTTVTDDDDATVIIVTGPLGSLGDRVWFDANANGLQDTGEAGIVGATVTLSADFNGDNVADYTATATTGTNGIYNFTALPAGTYTVSVDPTTLGGTLTQTYDLDGIGTANSAVATLASGQTRTDVDFGYVRSAPGFTIDKTANVAEIAPNKPVTYTYLVKNEGSTAISNVVVKDDNGTPNDGGDDFNPTRQADQLGDNDNLLEPGEVWKYSATVIPPVQMTVTTGGTTYDSGTLTYNTLANGDIRVSYRQSFNFNDNTYGTGSEGWVSRTHAFSDLTGSDKAGFEVRNGAGTVLFKFYQDYLTASTTNIDGYTSYSGYQSLGYSGGDGSLVTGGTLNASAATYLYDFDSTLETNLNRPGYTTATVNSPNDAGWDKVDGYSFVIKASAFGADGFGGVTIFDQHNSPAKTGGSNSYIPDVVGGPSTNTAVVTGSLNGQQVAALDDATVIVTTGGGVGGKSKFYVADAGADDVFGYSAAGGSTTSFPLQSGNTDPYGITGDAAGTKLWVLDKDKNVNVYKTDGTALGLWKAGDLGSAPQGIALDGSNLWMVDSGAKKVFWYQNAAGNVSGSDTAEWNTAALSQLDKARGITTDGTSLWVVVDDATDKVYRYTIGSSGGLPTLTAAGSFVLDGGNKAPTGITVDPTGASQSLWVVDSGTDKVYEYANGKTLTSTTNVAATGSFALGSGNTNPQDIFDPDIATTSALAQGHSAAGVLKSAGKLPALADLLGDDHSLDAVLGQAQVAAAAHAPAEPAAVTMDDAGELMRRVMEMSRHAEQSVHASMA